MGKIVAIGGGEIGRRAPVVETLEIDREIVNLSGKANPRLLFIPTASSDSETYYAAIQRHFGGTLGCRTDVLYLLTSRTSQDEIRNKILSSDIIYVGGGNTLKMMKAWRKLGVDEALREAYMRNIVLSGLSAGAICWFRYGSSDSRKKTNPEAGLIRVRCLGFVESLCCPHYHTEEDRRPHLLELMKKTPGMAIALDNCCGIEIVNEDYRIITSSPIAHAYRVFYRKRQLHEQLLEQDLKYRTLNSLFKR